MDTFSKYLEQLEDVLERGKPVPFSGKVSVDREKIYEIIDEIRLNVPNEIRQSQRIITEQEKIIADAKNKSTSIIKDAEDRALRLVDDHEVYKQALDEANEIIEESKKSAKDMRLNAMDYADEILAKTEEIIRESYETIINENRQVEDFFNRTIDVLYANRMELKGIKKQ